MIERLAQRLSDYDDRRSIGYRLRSRRFRRFLELIYAIRRPEKPVRILDIGGTRTYWRLLPDKLLANGKLSITILNLPDEVDTQEDATFHFENGDGCDVSAFGNDSFDIVHSNSVLEHVGDWDRMKAFAHEVRRLAPVYFVQTPNFWFPIEPHFMCPFYHWLPEPLRVRLLLLTGLGHYRRAASVDAAVAAVQSARLVNRHMMASLFPDAAIITERVGFLPKSLMAIRSGDSTSRATAQG